MFCVSSWCYFRNTRSKRHRGAAAAPRRCGWSPKRGLSSHWAHTRPIKRQRLAEAAQLLEAQKTTWQSEGHCEWKLPTPLALERREDRREPWGTPQGRKRRCPGNAVSRCSWCRDPGWGWSVAASGDSQRRCAKWGRRHPSMVSLLMSLFWECLYYPLLLRDSFTGKQCLYFSPRTVLLSNCCEPL